MRVARRIVLGLVLCASLHAAHALAGTLTITVRVRYGAPIDGATVRVTRMRDEGSARGPEERSGVTDFRGQVRIEVSEGRHQVDVDSVADKSLILPRDNPRAPAAVVEVGSGGADVTIELWRGRRVKVTLSTNRYPLRHSDVVRVHAQSDEGLGERELRLSERFPEGEDVLLPGRWTFRADVAPGWLLTDMRVDGASMPGAEARIDLPASDDVLALEWVVEGQAVLEGSIVFDGPECPVERVVATLIEPGEWIGAARARGGSVYDVITDDKPFACAFSMIVPSGRWSVVPRLIDACPDGFKPLEIRLVPDQDAALTFQGTCHTDRAPDVVLVDFPVRVVDSEGKPLEGALIELTPRNEPPGKEAARATSGKTNWAGVATLRVLPARSWHVVAGHAEHLDAAEDVPLWPPPSDSSREPVTITVGRASSVRVRAFDAAGQPLPGVAIGMNARSEPADLLTKESWRDWRRKREYTTDAEGQVLMKGLYPVELAVVASMRGADRESFIVSTGRAGEEPSDMQPLLLELVEGEETIVNVHVRPAARLLAHLAPHCAPIPDETEFTVVPAARLAPDQDDVDALLVEPTLARQRLPRSGVDQLELEIGPLATGSYLLAVRPAGFERWTLWPGTEVPFEADAIEGVEGDVVRLEGLTIECAPVAEIRLHSPAGGRSPDMRLADVQATWKSIDPKRDPIALSVRRLPTRVRLGGLPKGKGVITATLRHPHLLPTDLVTFEQAVDLKDGSLALLEKDVAEIGGAIVVTTTAPYVRIVAMGSDDPGRVLATDAGRATFASLRAGSWTLTECVDRSCTSVLQTWNAVLEPYRTLTLP